MLKLAALSLFAVARVLTNETLAVQKEDFCFHYIQCYETSPGEYRDLLDISY